MIGGQRLGAGDIERRHNTASCQRWHEVIGVHNRPALDVDQQGVVFHKAEESGIDHSTSFLREQHRKNDNIR
jgi:hypothetical protein